MDKINYYLARDTNVFSVPRAVCKI